MPATIEHTQAPIRRRQSCFHVTGKLAGLQVEIIPYAERSVWQKQNNMYRVRVVKTSASGLASRYMVGGELFVLLDHLLPLTD